MPEGRSLLLVDDDETTRELLLLLLTGEGWTVETAADGDAALHAITHAQALPDVILSDLQMPGLSGADLATDLRKAIADHSDAKTMPLLIAMTATDKHGLPTGFDDLLIKPFAPADLRTHCENLWAGNKTSAVETATPGEPVIAQAVFDQMKTAMPATQLRALYDFALNDAEARIERMASALSEHDDEAFRRDAHALKGSCGMVGALRLRSLAAAAEDLGIQQETLTESNPLSQLHEEIARIRHMLKTLLPSAD